MEQDDGYTKLAHAIIASAASDYRAALKKGNRSDARALERFFYSGWFLTLSGGADPDYILNQIREEVEQWKERQSNGITH